MNIFLIVCYLLCGAAFALDNADFDVPAIYQITEPVDLAEGPTWDGRKNILFYVDIHSGRVFSYNYKTTLLNSIQLHGKVTPVVPAKNDKLLIVGVNRSLLAIEWDGTHPFWKYVVLTTISKQFPESRFNDGKADNKGRLWFGTMGQQINYGDVLPNQGLFYKFTKDNLSNPTVELAPVNISNGLAWNAANNKLFYVDSPTQQVVQFDYNDQKGEISNRRVVFDLKNYADLSGIPDGMTIDEDDNLWIALYGGGSIIQVSPKNGKLLRRIALPARDVTSAMWGGPNLDILFVTTARITLTPEERRQYPAAGSVFAIKNLKTKGLPVFNADIVDSI